MIIVCVWAIKFHFLLLGFGPMIEISITAILTLISMSIVRVDTLNTYELTARPRTL